MWRQVSQENQLQGCKVIQEDGKTLTYREKIRKNNDPYKRQEYIFEYKWTDSLKRISQNSNRKHNEKTSSEIDILPL